MNKETGSIYKIVNTVTGKYYIGQTTNLKRRRMDHLAKLRQNRHYNIPMQEDFNNHGEAIFVVENYVQGVPINYLGTLERGILTTIRATNPESLYNINLGGEHNNGYNGYKHPEHVIEKTKTTKTRVGKTTGYMYANKPIVDQEGFIWPSIAKYIEIYGGHSSSLAKAIRNGWRFRGCRFQFLLNEHNISSRKREPNILKHNSKPIIGPDGFIWPSIAMYCRINGGSSKLLSAALNRGVGKKKWLGIRFLT